MLTTWMLLGTPAHACDWVVGDDAQARCERPLAIPAGRPPPPPPPEPPQATVRVTDQERDADNGELELRYGMQFLDSGAAHHGYARIIGKKDAYVGGEVRYLPANDLLWTARVGAGFDVFGKSALDLTLGLWIGGAGTWDLDQNRPVLYNTPAAGTEIALGTRIGRVFGKYRWLGGIGTSPLRDLLTENELTVGFSLVENVHLYGQYLVLDSRARDRTGALGLGIQATL